MTIITSGGIGTHLLITRRIFHLTSVPQSPFILFNSTLRRSVGPLRQYPPNFTTT